LDCLAVVRKFNANLVEKPLILLNWYRKLMVRCSQVNHNVPSKIRALRFEKGKKLLRHAGAD
jgi:hypothetical protein